MKATFPHFIGNHTVRTLKHPNGLLMPFQAFFLFFTTHTIFNTMEVYKFQLHAAQHSIGHMTSCVVIHVPIACIITKC